MDQLHLWALALLTDARARTRTWLMLLGLTGVTALFITSTLLDNPQMSASPALYSLIMFFTAGAFGVLVNLPRPPARP